MTEATCRAAARRRRRSCHHVCAAVQSPLAVTTRAELRRPASGYPEEALYTSSAHMVHGVYPTDITMSL